MDAPGKKILFDLLHHLNKERGITIVLVSHNMDDVADHADRVLVMENGQLENGWQNRRSLCTKR